MNKLILAFLLSLISPVFSQNMSVPRSTIQTYKNSVGVWNKKSESFDFNDFIFADIRFNLTKDSIVALDKSHSIYKIISIDTSLSGTQYSCVDEKNRKCILSVVSDKEESYLVILYDTVTYIYYIKI